MSEGPPKVRFRPRRTGVDDPRARAAIDAPPMRMPVDHHAGVRIALAQPSVPARILHDLVPVGHHQPAAREREPGLPWKLLEPRVFVRVPLRGHVVVAAHRGHPAVRLRKGIQHRAAADVAGVDGEAASLDDLHDPGIEMPVGVGDERNPEPPVLHRRVFGVDGPGGRLRRVQWSNQPTSRAFGPGPSVRCGRDACAPRRRPPLCGRDARVRTGHAVPEGRAVPWDPRSRGSGVTDPDVLRPDRAEPYPSSPFMHFLGA